MTRIRRLVLDVLKPHDPDVPTLGLRVSECDGVKGVNVTVVEIDREVENVKVTVEGDDIAYESVVDAVTEFGGSVHSIDEFACGEQVVEAIETPQD